jgi:hypothetical protein
MECTMPDRDPDAFLRAGFCVIWMAALVLGAIFSVGALTGDVVATKRFFGCALVYTVAIVVHIVLINKKVKENDER